MQTFIAQATKRFAQGNRLGRAILATAYARLVVVSGSHHESVEVSPPTARPLDMWRCRPTLASVLGS